MGFYLVPRLPAWILVRGKPTRASIQDLVDLDAKTPGWNEVAKSTVGDVLVSTMFLGGTWDHNHGIHFETMIFGGPRTHERVQYSTLEDAQAGHLLIVREIEGA